MTQLPPEGRIAIALAAGTCLVAAAALIYGVVWAIILPEGDERLGHVYNCFLAAMVLGMCVRVLAAWNRP